MKTLRVHTFWREPFLGIFCGSFLLILLLTVVYSFMVPWGENNLLAGDYPVFYSAGVLAGYFDSQLYSLEAQVRVQDLFWPEESDGFHVFAYPPFVAFFFIPLSSLPPVASKILYIFILSLVTLISTFILKRYLKFELRTFQLFSFVLLFAPFSIGILGGQNNAISFLLFLLMLNFHRTGNMYLLGFCLGLFNFKPQYALLAILFFIIIEPGRIKMMGTYLAVSLLQYAVSILYFGKDIFNNWISFMFELGSLNVSNPDNVSRMTSLVAAYKSLMFLESSILVYSLLAVLILLILLASFLVFIVFSQGRLSVSFLGPMIVFISPQTGFYDSVLLLPFLLSAIRVRDLSTGVWIILISSFLILAGLQLQFVYMVPALTILLLVLVILALMSEMKNMKL